MKKLQPSWAWTPEGVLEEPIVTLDDGYIVRCSEASRHPEADVLRLPGRLLLPGQVNAHSHAFQRAFRGHVQHRTAGRDDFWGWREAMYGVANRVDPDQLAAISRLAFLEMACSGITEVGEFHYLHRAPGGARYADPDELARQVIAAARDVGIRITLLRVAYHRSDARTPLRAEQQRFRADTPEEVLESIERLRADAAEGVRIGLAPHSIRAVPPDWLPELAGFDGVVHAHVAEQPAEVASCRAETGTSPLMAFAESGLVSERFSAVHLTHPSAGDVGYLARVDGTVVVCPSTELDLGDGFLPLEARRQLRLALGSDSHALIDLWHECRTLELHGRALAGHRHVLTPEGEGEGLAARLLRAASLDGGRALGAAGRGIEVGAPADLVALDLRQVAAAGMPPLEAAAFAASPSWVDRVWVGGRCIVQDGRHAGQDAILAEARAAMDAVLGP